MSKIVTGNKTKMNKKSLENIIECCDHSLYHNSMPYRDYYARASTDFGIIKGLAESMLNELEETNKYSAASELEKMNAT